MLNAFYGAFSPACFALLGLWLVVVQIRLPEWQRSPRTGGCPTAWRCTSRCPAIMSVLALVDPRDPLFWRVSFAIIALGGVVVLVAVRGIPGRRAAGPGRPGGAAPAGTAASGPGPGPRRRPGAMGQLGVAAYLTLRSCSTSSSGCSPSAGGLVALRTEAILLTAMLVLGFHVAWLMMFEDRQPYPAEPRRPITDPPGGRRTRPGRGRAWSSAARSDGRPAVSWPGPPAAPWWPSGCR